MTSRVIFLTIMNSTFLCNSKQTSFLLEDVQVVNAGKSYKDNISAKLIVVGKHHMISQPVGSVSSLSRNHSLNHPPIYKSTHSSIHSSTYPLIHSPIHSSAHPSTHPPTQPVILPLLIRCPLSIHPFIRPHI